MFSHTAPDSDLEAQLTSLSGDQNGYKAPLHRWQLRPEHVTTFWCLLLLDHFKDGSYFVVLHDTGNPRAQQLVD